MAFKVEGSIDVEVVDAYVADPRFDVKPGETNATGAYAQVFYDVCLLLQDADGNNDIWHGEISTRSGIGTFAHLLRLDITLQTLREIGFNVNTMAELEQQFAPAADRSITIPNLIGLKASVTTERRTFTKRNGTPGEAIQIKYLNALGGGRPKRITMEELLAKRSAPAAAPTPAPAPVAAPPRPPMPGAPAAGNPPPSCPY